MKLMKKMKWLLVVAVMLVCVFGVSSDVRAKDYENEKTSGDFRYVENEDGTVTITAYNGHDNMFTIPSEIDNKTVTRLDDNGTFYFNLYATEAVIPDSVTYIGYSTLAYVYVVYANPTSYARQYADSQSYIEFRCINHAEPLIDVHGTPATCTTSGLTDGKKCSECGYMVSGYNYIRALGHDEEHIYIAPTCTSGVINEWHCKRCGEITKRGDQSNPLGHTYNEGVITTEPTISSTGVKTYTCTRCGNTMTETIPRLTIPASGVKVTSANDSYKATKTSVSTKTLEYTGTDSNKSSITVPNTVTIDGVTYKVTSIAKNAFKNNKKLKKIVIGSNIKTIDANAFYGCKNLNSITIKSKNVKTVGKNAFKGIKSNAKIKVPVSKVEKYKKLLEGKGLKKTVKICK